MNPLGCPDGHLTCIFLVEACDKDGNKIQRTIRATSSRRARELFELNYAGRVDPAVISVKRP